MNRFILAAAALAATCTTAMAQDAKQARGGTESLPKACQDASPGQGMTGKAMEMGDMGEAQMASMKAIKDMDRTMRATHGSRTWTSPSSAG